MTNAMDRQIVRSRWTGRRARIGAGLGAAAVAAVVMGVMILGRAQPSTTVAAEGLTIDSVRKDVFHDYVAIQGQATPHDTLYLDALEGGQVQQVFAQAGDRVTAGQPLVKFRNTQVELDVLNREAVASQSLTQAQQYETQLEANHAANARSLEQLDYNIVRLKRALERRGRFDGQGVFPQEQLDQYKDELATDLKQRPVQAETNRAQDELRRAQLPVIHGEIGRLQESLKQIRARLDDLTVKAPMTGRLTAMDLKIGQNAKPGDRLAELVPDTGFKISADVDEYYLARIHPGQTAEATVQDKPTRLKVTRIYPQVKNGVFTVDMDFVGTPPAGLITGAAVQGKLVLGDDRPALVLPAGPFLERSGGDWVFVVSANGRTAEKRRIKIGRRNADQVEVTSGLQQGDRVVTSDYSGFEKIDRLDIKK